MFPVSIFPVPSGTTEKELRHAINHAIMYDLNIKYRIVGVIDNHALILARSQADQLAITGCNVEIFIHHQSIRPLIPRPHLVNEFMQLKEDLEQPEGVTDYGIKHIIVEQQTPQQPTIAVFRQNERKQEQKPQIEPNHNYPRIYHDEALEDGVYDVFDFNLMDADAVTWYQLIADHKEFTLPYELSEEIDVKYKSNIFKKVHNISDGSTVDFGDMTIKTHDGKVHIMKSTKILYGTLKAYGIIEFDSFYGGGHHWFIYDRKYGYKYHEHQDHPEKTIEINDMVRFKLFENVVQNPGEGNPGHGVAKHKTANKQFIAFDIEQEPMHNAEEYDVKEEKSAVSTSNIDNEEHKSIPQIPSITKGNTVGQSHRYQHRYTTNGKTTNPNHVTSAKDELYSVCALHPYYGVNIFDGMITEKTFDEENGQFVGKIKSFPYYDTNKHGITLKYHSFLFDDPRQIDRVKPGTNVNFCIGKDNDKDGGYIAYYIFISDMPSISGINMAPIFRRSIGKIIAEASNWEYKVWIQNNDTGNLSELTIDPVDRKQYQTGLFGRYNEKDITYDNGKARECICSDFILVRKHSNNNINADVMILGKPVRVRNKDLDQKYKFIHVPYDVNKEYMDIYIVVEVSEIYVNGFLNSMNDGRLYIGIDQDGVAHGLVMNKEKRAFIRRQIGKRLNSFKPKVEAKSYRVKFIQVIDINGYEIPDRFVIMIDVFANMMEKGWYTQHYVWYNKPQTVYDWHNNHEIIQCPALSEKWQDN